MSGRTGRLLEVMLAPDGFEVHTAANGEEALALVTSDPPDLILLDVMMPRLDGYERSGASREGRTRHAEHPDHHDHGARRP